MLQKVQKDRFEILIVFRRQIADEQVIEDVKDDDILFAEIIRLAVGEYGVKQTDIARRVRVSAAAVGRWAKQINLPHALARGPVIDEVVSILDDYIEREQRRAKSAKGDEVMLFSGRVTH